MVFPEHAVQEGCVAQIAHIESARALDGLPMPGAQIVRDHHLIAALDQQRHHVTADIAGSPGYQNGFHMHILLVDQTLWTNFIKASRPCGVHLKTPACSKTVAKTAPTSCRKSSCTFSSVKA